MTEEQHDGGPAFPQACLDASDVGMVHAGMSLRDWFAGQAVSMYVSDRQYMERLHSSAANFTIPFGEILAKNAYEVADAMLKKRARG